MRAEYARRGCYGVVQGRAVSVFVTGQRAVLRIIEDVDQGEHGDFGNHIAVRFLAGPGGKKSV